METIAEWTRRTRSGLGLTPEVFAAQVGVAEKVLRSWEGGDLLPSRARLVSLIWHYVDWRRDWALGCMYLRNQNEMSGKGKDSSPETKRPGLPEGYSDN